MNKLNCKEKMRIYKACSGVQIKPDENMLLSGMQKLFKMKTEEQNQSFGIV